MNGYRYGWHEAKGGGVMTTIEWQGDWQAFDANDREQYFLRELGWEIKENPAHPLHGVNRINWKT